MGMDEKNLPPLDRLRAKLERWWDEQSHNSQLAWLAALVVVGLVCFALGAQLLN